MTMAARELTIRRGVKVRHVETHYNWWGNPVSTTNEVVTVVGRVRDETGRFCRPYDDGAIVRVQPAKGDAYDVSVEYLEVYNDIWDLTHDELMELRGEVTLGSCYLADYDNSFGIDRGQVCDYCDGFGQSIGWDEDEDTPENFADYCEGVERYDEAA